MPASWPRSATGIFISRSACWRARSKQQRRQRIDRAVHRRDALFQRVEQVVRRHLAALEAVHDGHGIEADQFVAHRCPRGFKERRASGSSRSAGGAVHAAPMEKCFTSCWHHRGPIRRAGSAHEDVRNTRAGRTQRALARLTRALPEIFPAPVLTYALNRRWTPPMPRLAVDGYWRAHPLRADRLARALARAQRHAGRAGPGG